MAEGTPSYNIPDSVLEQLNCSICKGYLSCAPIRLLPDGNFICGRCLPNDEAISRALALEAVLKNTTFPCSFKQNGCISRLSFDQTISHELQCTYRSFMCPLSTSTCSWKGAILQICDHFRSHHPAPTKQNANFKLDVNTNSRETFVIVENNIDFIFKYLYDANEQKLKYDIRFCSNDPIPDVSYKLQLINDSDANCSINLKTYNCLAYDDSFYDVSKMVTLDLNKCMLFLDHPNCILVCIDFKIEHLNVNTETENDSTINYELLDSLRCGKCHQYLIPPLYELNGNTICCECAKTNSKSKPLDNPKLAELVNEVNYPCCWHKCTSVMKSNNLRNHELECEFRLYNCLLYSYLGCKDTFRLFEVIDHYKQKHQAEYFEKNISFKLSFSKAFSYKYIITMKNNTSVLFKYHVSVDDYGCRFHIRLYSSDLNMKTATLNFKHEHCRSKSKLFEVSLNDISLKLNDLPLCLRQNTKDEFTVSLFV